MRRAVPIAVFALGCVGLWLLPGPRRLAAPAGETARATVVEVDDSGLQAHGLIEFGTERLKVRLADGSVKEAHNELRAQLELDKKFKAGDTALVVLGDEPLVARDHWRLGWAAALFAAFAALLCAFGGWTGAKALFSFVFSCLAVWKLLVPLCLGGWNAEWTSFAVVTVLTAVIMYLVAGWTRKGLAAFLGAMLGVAASLALADVVAALMHVNGATMPFVQTLLYSGFVDLKLADVFVGATILASSGAVMDLAMDIAAGVGEVARHSPGLPRRELLKSGLRIGRSVVGTMTTTLLLAYSGGYLTLLMVFAAQGTAPLDFLNSTLVSAELVKTLVGSFGLVLVAPFTALVGAAVFAKGPGGAKRRRRAFVIAMKSEADAVRGALRPGDSLVLAGIGKANAASAAQRAIDAGATEVWNVGVAGGFAPEMRVGECYAVDRAVEYDFDLSQVNGTPVGVHDERTTPYFACATDGLGELPRATLATGDRFNDSEDDLGTLSALGATLRDMEGAAIAHVCEANGVPCVVVKCVSDVHGKGSMTGQYRDNLARALASLGDTLTNLV